MTSARSFRRVALHLPAAQWRTVYPGVRKRL